MDDAQLRELVKAVERKDAGSSAAWSKLCVSLRGYLFSKFQRFPYPHLNTRDFDDLFEMAVSNTILKLWKYGSVMGCAGFRLQTLCKKENDERDRQKRVTAQEYALVRAIRLGGSREWQPDEILMRKELLVEIKAVLDREKPDSMFLVHAWRHNSPPIERVAVMLGRKLMDAYQTRGRNIKHLIAVFEEKQSE